MILAHVIAEFHCLHPFIRAAFYQWPRFTEGWMQFDYSVIHKPSQLSTTTSRNIMKDVYLKQSERHIRLREDRCSVAAKNRVLFEPAIVDQMILIFQGVDVVIIDYFHTKLEPANKSVNRLVRSAIDQRAAAVKQQHCSEPRFAQKISTRSSFLPSHF